MRGRKPQPAEITKAKGNPGKRPIIETPEEVEPVSEKIPAFLDDQAAEIWRELIPTLKRMRFVKQTDYAALGRYCKYFSMWLSLSSSVEENGETYETDSKHGKMKRINPDLTAMMKVEQILTSFEDRIGLTPAARQRQLQAMAAGSGELPLGDIPEGLDEESQIATIESPIGALKRAAERNRLN